MAAKIGLTFPDGSKKEFNAGATPLDVAKTIGERLAMAAIAAKIDDGSGIKFVDLSHALKKDCKFSILTFKDPEGKEIFRHSTAHVLADAVIQLYPKAKPTIGPAVEEGFYYDFEMQSLNQEDIEKIEKRMQEIVDADLKFEKVELSHAEALKMFKDNPYKIEMINELPKDEKISAYKHGKFADFCRGPHIPSTGKIKAFKLTKVAGAYWRADAKNKQLQRIYGISFPDKKDLKDYLTLIEEAEKRDHRKIGRDMDLFMMHDLAPGMPFFLPNGMIILLELMKFAREYSYGEGYKEVRTPHIFNAELWKISGHWEHYKDDMFCIHHAEDKTDFGIKPMNCPAHMLIFKNSVRSYKELPLRIAETTTLYRNEKSGTLMGLTRVRSLSQDDTHIFLAESQILAEIKELLEKTKRIYSIFNLQIDEVNLSTRPEKFMGEKKTWDFAEANLKRALDESGLKYRIDAGGGAFYGPKIDVKVKDAIGRQWQLATIQLDYQMPQRFGLEYDDMGGKRKTPIVIHRAILGSMERFMGIIIEHFAGKLPLWIAPVQVRILPIADRHIEYSRKVMDELKKAGIRVELNDKAETIPKKVRDAELDRINYILVVGDKEIENRTVNVRTRENKVQGERKVSDLIAELKKEIETKQIK